MAEDVVLLAHGGGGLRSRQLLRDVILPPLQNPVLALLDDGALVEAPEPHLALTTDAYVVDPLFFPGGDIGRLAVCGTVNDLAMQAAAPRYLTLSLIVEEGLPIPQLRRAVASIARTADEAGVIVATGDTKVVPRGKGGGLFITTAGLGVRSGAADGRVSSAQPGDAILLSGTIGDHGIAVLCCREGLQIESPVRSDVAPLWGMIRGLIEAVPEIHALRDPTRGGLAAALCDIAEASGCGIRIRESSVPVQPGVRGACNLLGLDVLNVANEGKAVITCPEPSAGRALQTLRAHPLGRDAAIIGRVVPQPPGEVVLETVIGGERLLTLPSGEELPRIC